MHVCMDGSGWSDRKAQSLVNVRYCYKVDLLLHLSETGRVKPDPVRADLKVLASAFRTGGYDCRVDGLVDRSL